MGNKRGIAPLLATVLLITLAVILGVVVMNFGRAQLEIAAQCSVDPNMRVVTIDKQKQLCHDTVNNTLFMTVENGKQIPIEGLRVRIIGEKAVFDKTLPKSRIRKGSALVKNVPYDQEQYGAIRQVRISPRISLYDKEITCVKQSITLPEVRRCQE